MMHSMALLHFDKNSSPEEEEEVEDKTRRQRRRTIEERAIGLPSITYRFNHSRWQKMGGRGWRLGRDAEGRGGGGRECQEGQTERRDKFRPSCKCKIIVPCFATSEIGQISPSVPLFPSMYMCLLLIICSIFPFIRLLQFCPICRARFMHKLKKSAA